MSNAGEEGDLGKRSALEEAGEMVAGMRRTTRSVTRALSSKVESMPKQPGLANTKKELDEGKEAKDIRDPLYNTFLEWAERVHKKYKSEEEEQKRFRIWLSTKKRLIDRAGVEFSIEKMSWSADLLPSERRGTIIWGPREIPFKGYSPLVKSLLKTKEGKEEVEKTMMEFNEWAARHKRNYGSEEERETRFSVYLMNKRKIDLSIKVNRGYWIYGYDLENMDKFFWEASLLPTNLSPRKDLWWIDPNCSDSLCDEDDGVSTHLESDYHNMFREWAKRRGKTYETKEEEDKRFKIWLSSKNYIDKLYSHYPGYVFSLHHMKIYADLTASERLEFKPANYKKHVKLPKTKEGLEEMEKTMKEFNEWAARHKRNYGSKEEREKGFSAYVDNKRRIDMSIKLDPGYWIYGYDLENMDKFHWEANLYSE